MFGWRKHLIRPLKLLKGCPVQGESGVSLIEILIGITILGLVGIAFLGGIGTSTRATIITKEQSIAESLVRSEAEYVKRYGYQYDTSEYPVDPTLTIPEGWTVPTPIVEPVHASDDGLQKVTVIAQRQGETVLSLVVYKVAR
ncbi:MAG: type II secretion system protein [Dehalococcoidales bacterium]|nr:MAG: type II secretion system protein [Dehalococcoidales bacterium]